MLRVIVLLGAFRVGTPRSRAPYAVGRVTRCVRARVFGPPRGGGGHGPYRLVGSYHPLVREIELLTELQVIVALGAIGWDAALRTLAALGHPPPTPRPRFAHGAETTIGPYRLLGTYHPSQQNTFTGRLTPPMLEAVLERARVAASS